MCGIIIVHSFKVEIWLPTILQNLFQYASAISYHYLENNEVLFSLCAIDGPFYKACATTFGQGCSVTPN